jgi:protein gp37
MADQTNISWADMTHNEWIGCTRVSPACDGCYAAHLMETRMGRVVWGGPGKGAGTRSLTSEANRRKPYAWQRAAEKAGTRPFVFCSSLSDVFDNEVPLEWRAGLFKTIRETPNLVWLLLTKRPQLIIWLSQVAGGLPPNAAIGTTVEDQERADRNVMALINAANTLRPLFTFLSCEPLLGPIDLQYPKTLYPKGPPRCCSGMDCGCMGLPTEQPLIYGIDWVIAGGETDQGAHKARPTHPAWARSLRDQCAAAGVPFHWKQNGAWAGPDVMTIDGPAQLNFGLKAGRDPTLIHVWPDGVNMGRIGKHASGRLLDGVIHDARPEVK